MKWFNLSVAVLCFISGIHHLEQGNEIWIIFFMFFSGVNGAAFLDQLVIEKING